MAEGESVKKELTYYQRALKEFKRKYHDIPVCVESWRLRQLDLTKEERAKRQEEIQTFLTTGKVKEGEFDF